MPAIPNHHWPNSSVCLLPEPVTEHRSFSRPYSIFATHPFRLVWDRPYRTWTFEICGACKFGPASGSTPIRFRAYPGWQT